MSTDTLYERLGGKNTIIALVDAFYIKILADERVNHFFEDIDIAHLRAHQKIFLSCAFGHNEAYSGKTLREAHKHLVHDHNLNDEHFDIVAGHLLQIMKDVHISPGMIQEVMTIVESTRNDILDRHASA